MKKIKGFTLMELMVVVVIISILATMGATQYNAAKEKALDNEAKANLRLILAAERMYRMEDGNNPPWYGSFPDTGSINANLRLALTTNNPTWTYRVINGSPTNFCAEATRTSGTMIRSWKIYGPPGGGNDPQPQNTACP